jgi:diguanylate cyclase (GGDEF)-like protein
MSSFYSQSNETALNKIPDSLVGIAVTDRVQSRHKSGNGDSSVTSTMLVLNQTRAELEESKNQIEILKAKLKELEKVATTDLLTGLKNRRGFEDHFARELDRTSRGKSVGGILVVIDLDSFKAINDTYGHQAGDACLQLVAATLAHEIRTMDTASRLGGDEFVLLMTDATKEILLTRVQNIAWKLNHLVLMWNNQPISINASVGIRPYSKGDSAETIFAEADESMYLNKKRSKMKIS